MEDSDKSNTEELILKQFKSIKVAVRALVVMIVLLPVVGVIVAGVDGRSGFGCEVD